MNLLSILSAPTPSLIPNVFTSENAMTNPSIVSGLSLANTFLLLFSGKRRRQSHDAVQSMLLHLKSH
jgi:hypothetical protein